MDKYRKDLERMRAAARGDSFKLVDGTRYYLEPQPGLAVEKTRFVSECIAADYERRMRPEPHEHYKMLCKAKDRREAMRLFFPNWTPESVQNPMCPYNVWVLVSEGRLEDMPFAEDGWVDGEWQEVHPIPYDPEASHV